MGTSFRGFKRFFEATAKPVGKQSDSKDNLDMMSLTDLELGVTPKDHDKDVYAGSWFTMPGGKTIAGLSGFTVSMDGDTVTLTPVDYGNKVLQKTPSGKLARTPSDLDKKPITMSKAQYIQLTKRGLDQPAGGGMGGGMGMPPGMPGGM
jgi:hypothetical protein